MESMNKIIGKCCSKRAVFFTIDALIAAGILLIGLLIIPSFHLNRQPTVHLSYLSEDLLGVLSEMKVNEVDNPYIDELIANGDITNLNNTILEQIGEFWAENNSGIAENFTIAVIGSSVPQIYGYSVLVNNDPIYTKEKGINYSLISSRKIVSGYAKLQPVLGFVSKTYLTGIKDRKSSSFAYFGGFEGEGNITKRIFLPQNITNITEVYLEVDTGASFDLYINGDYFGNFVNGSGNGSYLIPDRWVLGESSHPYFHPGENNFSIRFTSGTIDRHYIAGGFLKVTYITPDTDELGVIYHPDGKATRKLWFPEVKGLVNLYSSFDVPGTLESMSLHLHILSNYTTYITIGNRMLILSEGNETEQFIDVDNSNFTAPPDPLDYAKMSNSTVPLRLASYNMLEQNVIGGNLDVVIITDMSGSMKKAVIDNSLGNLGANCDAAYADPYVRRTQLAKCLDKEMVTILMNYSGVRIWLVQLFNTDVISNWTRDTAEELHDVIDTDFDPNGKGKTCLSCAVNEAYDILSLYSSPNRTKGIVLMTDGIPTHTAIGNSTKADQEICVGYCDTTGACGPGDIEGCDDDNCSLAVNNTRDALIRAQNDLNASIYGVGFGPISECAIGNDTLYEMVQAAGGKYYSSNDPEILKDIYSEISLNLLSNMTQENQTVYVKGEINESTLYEDSYIEINYTPVIDAPVYGEIPVTIYGNEFGNNISEGILYIPEDVTLIDLRATSYSDILWTHNVSVYNGINSSTVFGLFMTSLDYPRLGDPFTVSIPVDIINTGINNTITVQTAGSPEESSGGSPFDRLVLIARISSLLNYGNVFLSNEGCEWFVRFEDGTNITINIPTNYTGSEKCYYENATYDHSDAMDDAAYRLFRKFDFDGDGELIVKFDENNIAIDTLTISDVPSLWGPAIVEVRVW